MPSLAGEAGEVGEHEVDPLGRYDGERNERGERHGQGKALLPNGDMYVGSYCKGLRHGKGLYVFRNGARYDGEWKRGLKHGQGIFWYPDGSRYEVPHSFDENGLLNFTKDTDFTCKIGDWKRDTKYGFGAYYYTNQDIYEGSWKKSHRHGMGTYLYSLTGTKFMGTWIKDRMQGPGQLIHPRHRFHGFWQLNLPYGRGCFIFENNCMQHGHYIHVRDPNYDEIQEEAAAEDVSIKATEDEEKAAAEAAAAIKAGKEPPAIEEPIPLKKGIIPLWRARYITAYNPDLLPPEPVPLQEETSLQSLEDKCEELWQEEVEYLKYDKGEYHGEYGEYYGENIPPSPTTATTDPSFEPNE